MAKQNTEDRDGTNERGTARGAIQNSGSDLAVENAALKARIAAMESAKIQNDADEKLIVAKMCRGLRREQARAVIYRQREFDRKREVKN